MGKKHRRKRLPIGKKESQKWLTSVRAVNGWAAECPGTRFISAGDAEADIYDVFCAPRAANVALLVRAAHDRCVAPDEAEDRLVRARLRREPVGWATTVAVRWRAFTLQPPANRATEGLPPVRLWAVWALEPAPPAGVAALDWLLWASVPTRDQAAAAERIAWYTCRWGVEVWHHVLTSGCALEARQLESVAARRRGLAL